MNSLRFRRIGAWPALAAMVLYALWPLLATAQPRGHAAHYELCPHVLLHNAAQENPGHEPVPDPGWGDHQLKCAFSPGAGDGSSPLPAIVAIPGVRQWHAPMVLVSVGLPRTFFRTCTGAPRGPPPLS